VDAHDNTHLWGEQYNRKLADLFSVQQEIVQQITDKLILRLNGEEQTRLAKRYTDNIEAYQLYLKGRYYWNRRPRGLLDGIKYFEQAIEKDPNYALAYSGLADCYAALATWEGGTISPAEAMLKANAAALKAVEFDETLAEAHASLGYIRLHYDWNWPEAEKQFKRAIELNSRYATAHHWYAHYLMTAGQTEASLVESRRALELDPLDLIISGHQPRLGPRQKGGAKRCGARPSGAETFPSAVDRCECKISRWIHELLRLLVCCACSRSHLRRSRPSLRSRTRLKHLPVKSWPW
jgi:tetratricopeptide (TPR) repeat protein